MTDCPLTLRLALAWLSLHSRQRLAPLTALLATLGIMLGVAALVAVTAVMQGLEQRLRGTLLDEHYHVLAWCSQDLAASMLEAGLIEAYVPCLYGGVLLRRGGVLQPADVYGLRPRDFVAAAGRPLRHPPSPPRLLPGAYMLYASPDPASAVPAEPGHTVQLLALDRVRYSPLGPAPRQRQFTLVSAAGHRGSGPLRLYGHYDDLLGLLPGPPAFRLYLPDPADLAGVEQALAGRRMLTWQEDLGDFLQAVALERQAMIIMLCLIIVVAAFNILAAMAMLVGARLQDIAILRTLGLTRHRILAVFMQMGLICALSGTAAGLAAGTVLASHAGALLAALGLELFSGGQSLPVQLNPSSLALAATFSLALACLCTLYPAWRAAHAPLLANLVRSE